MELQSLYNKEELKRIQVGARKAAKMISVTYGPAGCKMVSKGENNELWITDDAELLMSELHFSDYYEEIGRKMIAELYELMNTEAGSGGKTAMLIAETLFYRTVRAIDKNMNLPDYFKGLCLAAGYVYQSLDAETLKLDDKNVFRLIRTVMGKEYSIDKGLINIVDKNVPLFLHPILESTTRYEILDGCVVPCGIASGYQFDGTCIQLKECVIVVLSTPLTQVNEIAKLLLRVGTVGGSLAIFAPAFSEQVLVIIRSFYKKKVTKCLPIKASAKNSVHKRLLKDIALLTGTKVLAEDESNILGSSRLSDLGHAAEITASGSQTFMLLDKISIKKQEEEILLCKKELDASNDKRGLALRNRLAWLKAKIGVIYLSQAVEPPFYNYRRALKRALNTYLKCREEGVVPGGGISYLHSIDTLYSLEDELTNLSVRYGVRALRHAILQPFRYILGNAGVDYKSKLDLLLQQPSNLGYDAEQKKYADLLEQGILDSKLGLKKAIGHSFTLIYRLILQSDIQESKK